MKVKACITAGPQSRRACQESMLAVARDMVSGVCIPCASPRSRRFPAVKFTLAVLTLRLLRSLQTNHSPYWRPATVQFNLTQRNFEMHSSALSFVGEEVSCTET
jgi:hypothetical protein